MTDYTRDTPSLGRTYCPGCEPETDPTLEILDVRWCDAHTLQHDGVDDGLVSATAYLLGSVEAGGGDNRRWCEGLHRRHRVAWNLPMVLARIRAGSFCPPLRHPPGKTSP